MASPLSPKPLNPHAESWFPDSQKSSGDFAQADKLPFSLPHQICGTTPPHVSAAAVYEPLLEPPHMQLHPPVAMFQALDQRPFTCATVQHQCLAYECFPGYSFYPQQACGIDGFVMEKKDDDLTDVKMENLLEDSKSLKEILLISSRPRVIRKFVPPRLKRGNFEEFRGRKRLSGKVWKPKSPDDGVATSKILPPASHMKKEFAFCNNTTVMLKNIPNQYRRDSLIEFLNKKCCELRLAYDFLYLPMDFMKGDNLGFAFVNFTTASAAMNIKSALEGHKWGEFRVPHGTFTSKKMLEITWAKIQGKDALIRHFENSRFTCDNPQYLPVVICPPSNGSCISSLNPVGKLQGFCKSSRTPKASTKPSV